MLRDHKNIANKINKSLFWQSIVVGAFLILALLQSINAASVNLPQLRVVDSSVIVIISSSTLRNQGNNKAAAMLTRPKPKLTALKWAHAVNSQDQLTNALNSNIDMIEADIVMGKINNTGPEMPIMAHPPANTSDLSLYSFLQQIREYNNTDNVKKKGVKLDFKTIEVFEEALYLLRQEIPEMTYPIWLNADIVRGPVNDTNTVPVDPNRFLSGCIPFEKAVLSIGWTTKWSSECSNGNYTPDETNAMLTAIKNNHIDEYGHDITFPVRAGIAANSINELHDLAENLKNTNEVTLTIWSSQNDYVDVSRLREVIFSFGADRVYLDIPEELLNELDLSRSRDDSSDGETGGGGCGAGVAWTTFIISLINFILLSIGVYLINLYMKQLKV